MPPSPPCPILEEIDSFFRGSLGPEQAQAITAHLDGCESCRWKFGLHDTAMNTRANTTRRPSFVGSLLARGAEVGRYVVLKPLGAGGMGVVYAAYDPQLDRRVALKLVRGDVFAGDDAKAGQERLLREAQAMAKLSHPNVIAVHDVGTFGEQVFLAMELVEGESLASWIRKPRSWREVVALFVQAGQGLSAAHAAGLIHRDFKPDNVLVGLDGRARVTDFGLARPSTRDRDDEASLPPGVQTPAPVALTSPGMVIGTPAYMPPEQLMGAAADERSDAYSFCASLYEALAGEVPFPGNSGLELVVSVRSQKFIRPIDELRVPPKLREVLARGLAKDAGRRFATVGEVLEALAPLRSRRRRYALPATLAAAVLIASVVAVTHELGARRAQLCSGAEAEIAQVWGAPQKSATEHAFAATGLPYAAQAWTGVASALDGYSGRWASLHREACTATRIRREQPESALALKMVCLDERRHELDALVRVLSSADAQIVQHALQATNALGDLAACDDLATLAQVPRPTDAEAQRQLEAIRAQIAEAQVNFAAEKLVEGRKLADAAVAAAEKLEYRPALAEALLVQGLLEEQQGQLAAGDAVFTRAVREALASRSDEIAARALLGRAKVLGVRLEKKGEADAVSADAVAVLDRIGRPDALEGELEVTLGRIAQTRGDYAAAVTHCQKAVTFTQRAYPKGHILVGEALMQLGVSEGYDGDLPHARAHIQESLAIEEKAVGANHPYVADALVSLADIDDQQGHYADGVAELQRALAIDEPSVGEMHPLLSGIRVSLGIALTGAGRFDEAIAMFQRAIAIDEKVSGPAHPSVAYGLTNLATTEMRIGRAADAVTHAQRALSIFVASRGADHPITALAQANLGEALTAAGRPKEALAQIDKATEYLKAKVGAGHLEVGYALLARGHAELGLHQMAAAREAITRALEIWKTGGASPEDVADARLSLAKATVGTDHAAAIALATQARDQYRASGPAWKRELDSADRWLAENPAR
jgi:tetratricopeptide (TPR) repeat protein